MTDLNKEEIEDAEIISEETQEKPQYQIVEGDIDGVPVKGVRANETVLFTVAADFTPEQIQETFNIANRYFNEGVNVGTRQKEAQILQAIGLTPDMVKHLYDLAVAKEAEANETEAKDAGEKAA